MSHNLIHIDKEICTGCKRCVEVCPVDAIQGLSGQPHSINLDTCVACGQCVQVCSSYASEFDETKTTRSQKLAERGMLPSVTEPLFAAYAQCHTQEVKDALNNPKLFTIVQSAPAVRVALAEEFGMPLGSLTPGKLAAALRRLKFNRVYDTNFGADITIMEEGSELIQRVTQDKNAKLPMFTSCCPAWVKYIEQDYPELLDHLSSCKSPMGMAAPVFKTIGSQIDKVDPSTIFSVAIMPCTCKHFEAARPEMNASGYQDTDVVITTRELAQLIKDQGIDFINLPDENFDQPFGEYSGAGAIFGVTGGVMEAALRTGYELATKKSIPNLDLHFVRGDNGLRTADVKLGDDLTVRIAVVAGLDSAKEVLESVKNGTCDYHFVEVMTCPEGCMTGGGQPKLLLDEHRKLAFNQRRAALYNHDTNLEHRKSHENPSIKKLYGDYLGEPLGHEAHHLLHTTYKSRKVK